jgi:hypothetical protein
MHGADGSTTFSDESSKTWTAYGNAQIDTAQSKFGGASVLFDGNGDYIETNDSEDFNVGAGDFTVDFWFKKNGNGIDQAAFGQSDSALTQTTISVYGYMGIPNNTLEFGVFMGTTPYYISSSATVADTNWHHFAGVRSGNTLYLFLDGVSQGTRDVTGVTVNNSSEKIFPRPSIP